MSGESFDLHDLVALAGDAIIVRRLDGNILFWNGGAERLYGWPAAEAAGRRTHDLLDTRFPQPLDAINASLLQSHSWHGVLRHVSATGANIVVVSRWVYRGEGDDGVVLEINRDDTERYYAEAALQAQRRQFELLTDHLTIMVAHCDRDLRFVYVNREYASRFGLTPADMVGRRATEIADADAFRAAVPYIEQVLAGQRATFEMWAEYPKLGPRYVRCTLTPELDASGRVAGFIAGVLDETEHRRAQDALAASRARLDFVASSVDIGVWSGDLPLDRLIWNAACKAHFGLRPDAEVTIGTFFDRIHPADVEATRAAIDAALSEGVPYDVELRARQQDGSFRWLRAMGRAEYDASGTPTRFEGITIDISDAKQANERIRELADAMPQIVWSTDASGAVDYLNRRWYELTRKPVGSLDLDGVVHPDDVDGAMAAFRSSVETGEPYEREYRLQLPGFAEPRWFLGRALPVRDEAGRITRWYATSTDIDDQKHIEAALVDSRDRLRAALDASATGTFRWDIDSNELDWDDNLDRLFGLPAGSTARSLPEFVRLVHPDDRQRVVDSCVRCAEEGADFMEEFRVVWPDGTVRWLLDRGRAIAGADGRRYMIGACHDVTGQRLKEEALRAADRQKDEFLGMLAHEIRNPLAPILYSASILERRIDDPALRRPLEVINRQASRMIRIVDDLLDVSRVTQGKILLQRQPVDIATLLTQAVEAVRPIMDARNHTLHLRLPDAPCTVFGDPVRLAQILENLLLNAAKYTPNGGMVELAARSSSDSVSVMVRDSGVGLAPDMLVRVFDLFAQADTSLDRAEGGLGIGLTLVDRLTRMHGGTVVASSDGLGRGSRFTVRLPLAAAAKAPHVPESDGGPGETARRVLIVDDNRDAAEMLRALITAVGHAVQVAHDGSEAVRLAAAFQPEIVLLDIGLPGKDGYEVVEELRAIPAVADALIVAATGYGTDDDRARCLASGFDDHARKPIELERLQQILRMQAAPR